MYKPEIPCLRQTDSDNAKCEEVSLVKINRMICELSSMIQKLLRITPKLGTSIILR